MREFTLYLSDGLQETTNLLYKNVTKITNADDLKQANQRDMVMAMHQAFSRRSTNFLGSDCLFADFDDGMSIEEFQNQYRDYSYYISTSKSHRKEKNGVACDRFHAFFPITHTTDQSQYLTYLKKLIQIMGSDPACKDSSRFFFGNPNCEVFSNQGKSIIELLDSVELEKPVHTTPTQAQTESGDCIIEETFTYKSRNHLNKSTKTMVENTLEEVSSASEGSRNSTLFEKSCFLLKLKNGDFPVGDISHKIVSSARESGLDDSEIYTTLASATEKTKNSCIDYAIEEKQKKKEKGEDASSDDEVLEALNSLYEFRQNVVRHQKEIKNSEGEWEQLTDDMVNQIWYEVRQRIKGCSHDRMYKLLSIAAVKYDPFQDYFSNLEGEWDGQTDYIKQLADTVKTTDKKVWDLYFRRWFVASVGQMLGRSINHSVLIMIEPRGGTGKSAWFKRLNPVPGYTYEGAVDANNKDSLTLLVNKGLIILDEFEATTRRSEFQALKSLITRDNISFRAAYGRELVNYTRRASFCGTSNLHGIILDQTGSRRWLCVEIDTSEEFPINFEYDVDILHKAYAQAYSLYRSGEKYWFDGADISMIEEQNKDFKTPTLEEELIEKYVVEGSDWYTGTEIMIKLQETSGQRLTLQKVGQLLRLKGYAPKGHKVNGVSRKMYQLCILEDDSFGTAPAPAEVNNVRSIR